VGEGSNVKGDNRGKSLRLGKGEGLRVGKRGRVKVG
jgi:hypothetical protein